jgi:hypothetical protein
VNIAYSPYDADSLHRRVDILNIDRAKLIKPKRTEFGSYVIREQSAKIDIGSLANPPLRYRLQPAIQQVINRQTRWLHEDAEVNLAQLGIEPLLSVLLGSSDRLIAVTSLPVCVPSDEDSD